MKENTVHSLKDLENPEVLKDLLETGKRQIQDYPVLSVAIAAGVGFAIGFAGVTAAIAAASVTLKPTLGSFDPLGLVMNAINGTLSQSKEMKDVHKVHA